MLRFGWSQEYAERHNLMEKALSYADPGGELSYGTDYEDARARGLLHTKEWTNSKDLLSRNEAVSPDCGWRVKYDCNRPVSSSRALSVAEELLIDLWE